MHQIDQIPQNELEKIERILIIQYKPFGDILLNTGYLPTLREKFPNAQIDYLIQRPYKTLLEDNPYLDNLVIMENKKKKGFNAITYLMERFRIMRLVRAKKYDLIIDQLRGTGSAQICLFSGAKYKLGWTQKRWKWVYNYKIDRDNQRYYSRVKFDLLQPLGIKEVPHKTYYKIHDSSIKKIDEWLKSVDLSDSKFVVFSPGTPVLSKQWELDNFATLGDKIMDETDFKLVLLWGPNEKQDVEYISGKMKNNPIIAIPTTFNEAGALLKRAAFYISNDGGINHLAIAMETPTVAIFGPRSNPKKWSAWHEDIHTYLRNWDYKRADYKKTKDQTFGVTPQMVFDEFMKLKEIVDKKN